MTTYNLTVDVHDLEPTGPVPASAEVRIWRALPDASGPQVVSVKQKTYPVGTGPVVVTLTVGVAYWAEFTGVRGWEAPFLFSGTTDTSIAERFRNGQLDPTSLQPITTVPSIAATIAALSATYVSFGPTAPDHTVSPVWVDTSVTPQVVKGWSGTAWVAIGGGTGGGAVSSVAGRTGAVVLAEADITGLSGDLAAKAPLASPAFTGTPTIGGTAVAKTTDITSAIAALVGAAPSALDTLKEIDDQISTDEGSAAALAALVASKAALLTVQANRTGNATLAVDTVNPFDATAAPLTGTLPTPTKAGQVITVEKVDTSANLVTIAGTLRGVAGSLTLSTQYESIFLVAEPSLTSWRPIAGHKTKTALDTAYGDAGVAGLIKNSASSSRAIGDVIYQRFKDAIFDASLLPVGPVTTTQGQYGGFRGSGTPLVQAGGYITAAPPDATYVEGQTVGTAQFARIIIDWPSTSGATVAVVFSAAPGFPGVTGVTGSDKAGVHAVLASGYAAGPDLGFLDAYQYGTGVGATHSNHALANFKGTTTTFDFHVDKTTGRVRVFQTIGTGTATLILDYTEASITSAISNAATFEFYDGDGTVLPAHIKYFWVSPTLDPVGNLTPVSSGTFAGPQINVYTTPGSFSVAIPAGAKTVEAVCVGGGGGGGSGASGAASTVRSGGGGGGGGGRSVLPPTDLTLFTGSTIPITVGGGGAGGAAATSASGATGGLGGQTVFGATASGPYMTATGGSLGVGGSTVQGTGGSGGTGFFNGGAGSTSSSSGGAGPAPVVATAATGGAAGGGITTANAQSAGGNGIQTAGGPQGITIGGAAGGTAGLALAQVTVGSGLPGRGGAGGGSNLTGAGGAGGAGEIYGGGGGGGGAAVTGNASGAGGAGAGGIVVVTFR